jgi:hypothetical protein
MRLRHELRDAQALVAFAQHDAGAARRNAETWRRRALTAERRAARARQSLARAREEQARLQAHRDRLVRALNRRVPLHDGLEQYIDDADALFAIASGLFRENEDLRGLLDDVFSERQRRTIWDD